MAYLGSGVLDGDASKDRRTIVRDGDLNIVGVANLQCDGSG